MADKLAILAGGGKLKRADMNRLAKEGLIHITVGTTVRNGIPFVCDDYHLTAKGRERLAK